MKRLLLAIPITALTAGCAIPLDSMSGRYQAPYGHGAMYPRPAGPQVDLGALPIGRWDNVMMSGVGTPLLVLMKNGATVNGTVIAATSDTLRIHVAAGDVELQAADTMRVDRLAGGSSNVVKDGVRGAAFGAGVVGVLGLIAGHAPPPRLFAAGGIIGAYENVQLTTLLEGATTIYLAEAAMPARVRARTP